MRSRLGFGLLANTVALFFLGAPRRQYTHQKQNVMVLIWMESSFAVNHALDISFFFDSLGIFSHLMGPLIKSLWQNHQYSNSIMNISPTFPKEKRIKKYVGNTSKWDYSAVEIHEVPTGFEICVSVFAKEGKSDTQRKHLWALWEAVKTLKHTWRQVR